MDVQRVILLVLLGLCRLCGALSLHRLASTSTSISAPTAVVAAAIPFEWVRTEGDAGYEETCDRSYQWANECSSCYASRRIWSSSCSWGRRSRRVRGGGGVVSATNQKAPGGVIVSFHNLISSLKDLGYARDRGVSWDSTLKLRTQKLRPLFNEGMCTQRFRRWMILNR